MKIPTKDLLADLKGKTHFCLAQAKTFNRLNEKKLYQNPAPGQWSVAECLEHLNIYADFYLPEIQKALNKHTKPASASFKPGFLGNIFAKSMLVKNGKMTKMGAPKDANPGSISADVVNRFIAHQKQYLKLIKEAENVNLNKLKTPVTISKWIKLRLGDTLRVQVYHNERHVLQAMKVLKKR